ncbi:MAG: hypothetical protein KDK36_12090 [Leptospiraceae bacterium]|nr:hypothetical protein [Leptospiraceae bacterium]
MNQSIQEYMDRTFSEKGLDQQNIVNKMKKRNILIQLCTKGIDVENLRNVSTDNSEIFSVVKATLDSV